MPCISNDVVGCYNTVDNYISGSINLSSNIYLSWHSTASFRGRSYLSATQTFLSKYPSTLVRYNTMEVWVVFQKQPAAIYTVIDWTGIRSEVKTSPNTGFVVFSVRSSVVLSLSFRDMCRRTVKPVCFTSSTCHI